MAREEELKRVDLKVNVSCCDGCRRKVMKAMSLKGVLRTEIHPSLDRVTVVGNVDTKVLVKKLAKVGKIAEVVPEAAEEKQKKREGDGGKDRDGGDRPAGAEKNKRKDDDGGDRHAGAEKSKRKDDGKDTGDKAAVAAAAASYKEKDCHKCTRQQSAGGDDAADHGKAKSSKATAAARDGEGALEEEGDGSVGAKSFTPDHAAVAATHLHQYQYQYQYHRAEPPTMAVPVQHMPAYYAAASVTAPSYYGGYYAPPPTVPMPWRPAQQQRPVSRFDVDYFNEDNTVGCSVM